MSTGPPNYFASTNLQCARYGGLVLTHNEIGMVRFS